MARQSTPPRRGPAQLSAEQMRKGIDLIGRRLSEIETFDLQSLADQHHHIELDSLGKSIDDTLVRIFGNDTLEYTRYRSAAHFYTGPISMGMGSRVRIQDVREYVKRSIEANAATLRSAIKALTERLEDEPDAQQANGADERPELNDKIFIVHGHESGPKEAIARFLSRIGFTPIILHEQPNKGQTIIEKFEGNSDVGFAVVVLTPDDAGTSEQGSKRRARQNVILELGYFIGKLGRPRVCAIRVGDVEIPSDIFGVVYTDFDSAGGWQRDLAIELQAAGHDIDWNKVMKS